MSERITILCDICKTEIKGTYIGAGVYGVDAHPECFENLTPRQVLKFLGLDEIVYINREGVRGNKVISGMPPILLIRTPNPNAVMVEP